MNYIKRHLERKFISMSGFFKAIMVTGARQVGKTTMLRHLSEGQNRTYVTLDDAMARDLAQSDPALFFQAYKPPILIDEVQKAPELFERIKVICDGSDEVGLFWLTGSQQYGALRKGCETLAGRVCILNLHGLSQSEKAGVEYGDDLDFTLRCLNERRTLTRKNDIMEVYEHIWRGGIPQVQHCDHERLREYFESYVSAFLQRDVAEIGGVTDSVRFNRFLSACAALVGEQVRYRNLSEAAEISEPTAKSWLSLLEGMCVIHLIRPFHNNALSRLAKTPKLYFYDTGLAAHLSMWLTRETLMNGAASGHFFENYVVSELLKGYSYARTKYALTYYRDQNAKEIDIIIEGNGRLHPLEIKRSSNPDRRTVRKFAVLEKSGLQIGAGGIICMCEEPIPIDSKNFHIPCNLI